MKTSLTRQQRRAMRRAPAPADTQNTPQAGTQPKETVTPPVFDAQQIAADTIAAFYTDPVTGRHTVNHVLRHGGISGTQWAAAFTAPNQNIGHWSPPTLDSIRLNLSMTIARHRLRALDVRVDAALKAFTSQIAAAGPDLAAHVDIDAITEPDQPTDPPATWTRHDEADARSWIAAHCYVPEVGRGVAVFSGQLYVWRKGAWQHEPGGITEWIRAALDAWTPTTHTNHAIAGQAYELLNSGMTEKLDPAQLAAFDLARERAQLADQQTRNQNGTSYR